MGSLQIFQLPPGVQRHAWARLTSDSKLTIGVNVSVNSCMPHCVSPVADWRVFQIVTQTKIDE